MVMAISPNPASKSIPSPVMLPRMLLMVTIMTMSMGFITAQKR